MLALYFTYIDEEPNRNMFEEIYFLYRKQMLLMALSIVHNHADAEDVVHEVFLKIATKHISTITSITDKRDIRNYLLTATKNTAMNFLRKTNGITYIEPEIEDKMTFSLKQDDFVERICERMEYEQVIFAIKQLEEKYRDVLYYHYVLELPVSKVANILHQTVSTTKKQLARGKKKLLRLLEVGGGINDEK